MSDNNTKISKMIIYKVSHNYHKGITEFQAIKDNKDGTFDYEIERYGEKKIRKKSFVPEFGLNQAAFFVEYNDAKEYLINKIKKTIENYEHLINKSKETLKNVNKL